MEGLAFIPIADATQPAEARRVAYRMADEIGFTEEARGRLGIVVTEAATNVLKHGGSGQIILQCTGPRGLNILALDAGPGMRSVSECLRDGYSTAGSQGTGLGAIRRLSSESDIYSLEGRGTVVQAFCGSGNSAEDHKGFWDISAIIAPMPGESLCGDHTSARETDGILQIMLADGLGHGPLAADASTAAGRVFETTQGSPQRILEAIHAGLHSTRGAAAAVAEIDPRQGRVRYCGVGNIAGAIVTGETVQQMVSMNGIVGHQTIRAREFEYLWSPHSIVVMHSDGLSSRWRFTDYPGLASRRSSLIAAVLFRDLRKTSDDATVFVGRQK